MRRVHLTVMLITALFTSAASAKGKHHHGHSHKAHSHGDAKLDVATDGKTLAIEFEAPGDVVFGFEHKARTDAQKNTIAAEVARLNEKYGDLFILPQDAKCVLTEKAVSASQAAEGTAKDKANAQDKKKDQDTHADVRATYNFTCASDLKGRKLKLGLFATWPRLKNLKVQVLGSGGQKGTTLKNDKTELDL